MTVGGVPVEVAHLVEDERCRSPMLVRVEFDVVVLDVPAVREHGHLGCVDGYGRIAPRRFGRGCLDRPRRIGGDHAAHLGPGRVQLPVLLVWHIRIEVEEVEQARSRGQFVPEPGGEGVGVVYGVQRQREATEPGPGVPGSNRAGPPSRHRAVARASSVGGPSRKPRRAMAANCRPAFSPSRSAHTRRMPVGSSNSMPESSRLPPADEESALPGRGDRRGLAGRCRCADGNRVRRPPTRFLSRVSASARGARPVGAANSRGAQRRSLCGRGGMRARIGRRIRIPHGRRCTYVDPDRGAAGACGQESVRAM